MKNKSFSSRQKFEFLSKSDVLKYLQNKIHLSKIEQIYDFAKTQNVKFLITTSTFHLLPNPSDLSDKVHLNNTINILNEEINRLGLPGIQLRIAGAVPESSKHASARWNILEHFLDKESGDFYVTDINWDAIEDDPVKREIYKLRSELLHVITEYIKSAPSFSRGIRRVGISSWASSSCHCKVSIHSSPLTHI